MPTDPKPTSALRDVFPAPPATVEPAFTTAPTLENPVEVTSGAYTPGTPILGEWDDQQLPDTDKGISG